MSTGPRSTGRRDRVRSCVTLLFVTATLSACGAPIDNTAQYGAGAAAGGLSVQAVAGSPGTAAGTPDDLASPTTLADRIEQAVAAAAARGATVTVAVLDRSTGIRTIGGADDPIETASVVKLFIADDLLFRDGLGEIVLTDADYDLIEVMLTASDDSAASTLWDTYGGGAIVERVADRHALTGTVAPEAGWWNTVTTASDLLTWYDELLSGTGGLDEVSSARVISHLMGFRDTGTDGYDQRFGLPDAAPAAADPGTKAGWMCCLDDSWIHLSTGFFGDDHRYVVVALSKETVTYESDSGRELWFLPDTSMYDATEDESARHARETVTVVLETVLHG